MSPIIAIVANQHQQNGHLVGATFRIFRSVILCSYKQLLERWNKLLALKQKFGNRPVWPTKLDNIIA